MALVSTPQSLLSNSGQQLRPMILQVRLHIVVATQYAHYEDATLGRIRLGKQAPVLQHLKAESWRGAVQSNDINWPLQSGHQQRADLQCARENRFVWQPFPKQDRHIHIAQGVRGSFGNGAEQVHRRQVIPTRQSIRHASRNIILVDHDRPALSL